MGDSLTGFLNSFIGFIMGLIDYIKDLVGYFRDENDGEDGELPELSF